MHRQRRVISVADFMAIRPNWIFNVEKQEYDTAFEHYPSSSPYAVAFGSSLPEDSFLLAVDSKYQKPLEGILGVFWF